MTNPQKGILFGLGASFSIVLATALLTSPPTRAETKVEIIPIGAGAGAEAGVSQGGYFRWMVRVQVGAGVYEDRTFLISSDALFRFQQGESATFQNLASRVFSVGAVEAMIRQGHVGIGFNGVQFGEDSDLGLRSLLRTGAYLLGNLIKTDNVRLDLHTGYNYDRFTSLVGAVASRGMIDQSANLHWNSGPWSGTANAHFGMDQDHFIDPAFMSYGANASVRGRIFAFSDFELGLSAMISAEHDSLREEIGLNPNDASAMVLMDLSWVERIHTN